MRWLDTLLRLGRAAASDRARNIVGLVERIARVAGNRDEFRRALVDAAESGDLDFVFNELNAAKAKADDYIKNG